MATFGITEIFESIQGESTYAGLGCWFVRLAGCNLKCVYCDTPNAMDGSSKDMTVNAVVALARHSRMPLLEITGGEPLLQEGFVELASELLKIPDKTVLVETNGSIDLGVVPEGAVSIVDIKCPASGAAGSFDMRNLKRFRPIDEVKFVLMDYEDYKWARSLVLEHDMFARVNAVHFSPVVGELEAANVGNWIMDDGLPVRLQVQLHKIVGMP